MALVTAKTPKTLVAKGFLQIFKRELTGWRIPFANGDTCIVDQNIQPPIGLIVDGPEGAEHFTRYTIEVLYGGFARK